MVPIITYSKRPIFTALCTTKVIVQPYMGTPKSTDTHCHACIHCTQEKLQEQRHSRARMVSCFEADSDAFYLSYSVHSLSDRASAIAAQEQPAKAKVHGALAQLRGCLKSAAAEREEAKTLEHDIADAKQQICGEMLVGMLRM